MGYLKTGMHAGVGATCTHQVDRMVGNAGRGPGKFCLHRTHATLLQLPAMKGLTVVLKDDGNPSITNGVICGERLRREEQVLTRLLSTEKAKRRLNGRRLPRLVDYNESGEIFKKLLCFCLLFFVTLKSNFL